MVASDPEGGLESSDDEQPLIDPSVFPNTLSTFLDIIAIICRQDHIMTSEIKICRWCLHIMEVQFKKFCGI
jgi:hypothetical protein